jgi:hypothetical protein
MLVCICVSGTLFTGCSSDIEDGSTTSSQEQKIRESLMEYAEDFDVNFKLNDNISYSELTTDEIDTLKEMIKGFSSLKGTYKLVRSLNNGVYHAELKNEQLSHPLTRSSSPESATLQKYYNEELGCTYDCTYEVIWDLTDKGRIENMDEDGSISCTRVSGYSTFTSNSYNFGTSVTLRGSIVFHAMYTWADFTIDYSGTVSGDECDVTFS